MKIIITSHLFPPEHTSGTELIAYNIAKELQSRDHEVIVIAARPMGNAALPADRFEHYVYHGLPVYRFLHSYDTYDGQNHPVQAEYNHRLFYKWFREFLAQHKPDVVHFVHLNYLSASSVDACAEARIPMVFTATDFWTICPTSRLLLPDGSMCSGPQSDAVNCIRHLMQLSKTNKLKSQVGRLPEPLLRFGIRLLHRGWLKENRYANSLRAMSERPNFIQQRARRLDFILAPSHTVEDLLIQSGFPREKVRYLPYGVQTQRIERSLVRGNQPLLRVGFVGQICEHKGCHVLVRAVRSLSREAPVRVRFHGDTVQDPRYYELLRELAADDPRIEFCGRFENTEINAVLSDTDVIVCPSLWYENTPLAIYEAMAAGVPVIASNLQGMAEAIKAEVNGLLFEKGNSVELGRAINRLLNDRALVRRLAVKTEPPTTVAAHVSELEKLYTGLLCAVGQSAPALVENKPVPID